MARLRFAPLLAFALLCAPAARAHDADILYARYAVAQGPTGARVEVTLKLTAGALAALAPVDVDGDGELTQQELDARSDALAAGIWEQAPAFADQTPCRREKAAGVVKDGYVELTAQLSCGRGELRQTFRLLSVLPPGFRVIASGAEGAGHQFAQGTAQTVIFAPAPGEPRERVEGLAGWVGLGIFHIFTGVDHLAFLVALLLVAGGWKRILALVTSFTVAHSITLGASALDVVRLSAAQERWAEVAIAVSIVFVAAQNLLQKDRAHRVGVTFLFGLIHGFGFASVLRSYGLEEGAAKALFGFNVGVELGQACVVAALWPPLYWLRRWPAGQTWTVRVGSGLILVVGGYWVVTRALG